MDVDSERTKVPTVQEGSTPIIRKTDGTRSEDTAKSTRKRQRVTKGNRDDGVTITSSVELEPEQANLHLISSQQIGAANQQMALKPNAGMSECLESQAVRGPRFGALDAISSQYSRIDESDELVADALVIPDSNSIRSNSLVGLQEDHLDQLE